MVTKRTFGKLSSGEEIQIFHLENKAGAYAEISQFGAILVKLCVPDREGKLTDVVLGYDDRAMRLTDASLARRSEEAETVLLIPDLCWTDRKSPLHRMRAKTICTVDRMVLRKKSGMRQRFPRTKMQ